MSDYRVGTASMFNATKDSGWSSPTKLLLCLSVLLVLAGCNTFSDSPEETFSEPDAETKGEDAGTETVAQPKLGFTDYRVQQEWSGSVQFEGEFVELKIAATSPDEQTRKIAVGVRSSESVEIVVGDAIEPPQIEFDISTTVPLDLGSRGEISDLTSFDMKPDPNPERVLISGIGSQLDCAGLAPEDKIWSWHTRMNLFDGEFRDIRSTNRACANTSINPLGAVAGPAIIMQSHFGTYRFIYRENLQSGTVVASIDRDFLDPLGVVVTRESATLGVSASRGGVWFRSFDGILGLWSAVDAAGDIGESPALADPSAIARFEPIFQDEEFASVSLEDAGHPRPILIGVDSDSSALRLFVPNCRFVREGQTSQIGSVDCEETETIEYPSFSNLAGIRTAGNVTEHLGVVANLDTNRLNVLLLQPETLSVEYEEVLDISDRELIDIDIDTHSVDDAFIVVVAALTADTETGTRVDIIQRAYTPR